MTAGKVCLCKGTVVGLGPMAGGFLGTGNVCVRTASGSRQVFSADRKSLESLAIGQEVEIVACWGSK